MVPTFLLQKFYAWKKRFPTLEGLLFSFLALQDFSGKTQSGYLALCEFSSPNFAFSQNLFTFLFFCLKKAFCEHIFWHCEIFSTQKLFEKLFFDVFS